MTSLDSYSTLGRSGLRVSPLTLGTMTFGEDHGYGASPDVSAEMIATYLDRGGNSIDTANLYTNGHSEKIVGDFFARSDIRRDQAVIGTKFYCSMFNGDPNAGGAGRKAMIQQVDASLRRLQTDYVDILWLHNWDQATPIEETLRGLEDLVTSGKTRYVAFSDLPAWKVAEAQTIAVFRGWSPIIALQLEHSLLERTVEGELIPMARELGIGVMPWGPLRSGLLSGKFRRDNAGSVDTARRGPGYTPTDTEFAVIDALLAVSEEIGASPAAVGLAWVRGRAGVSSTIIGARRVDQLVDNLGSVEVTLTDEQTAALDDASAPTLNFPAPYSEYRPALAFPARQ